MELKNSTELLNKIFFLNNILFWHIFSRAIRFRNRLTCFEFALQRVHDMYVQQKNTPVNKNRSLIFMLTFIYHLPSSIKFSSIDMVSNMVDDDEHAFHIFLFFCTNSYKKSFRWEENSKKESQYFFSPFITFKCTNIEFDVI